MPSQQEANSSSLCREHALLVVRRCKIMSYRKKFIKKIVYKHSRQINNKIRSEFNLEFTCSYK